MMTWQSRGTTKGTMPFEPEGGPIKPPLYYCLGIATACFISITKGQQLAHRHAPGPI